jgi:hypothetical protein
MDIKAMILAGLKPALIQQLASDIDSGKLLQPIDFVKVSDATWKKLRMNLQTAGAITVFRIKQVDIESVLRDTFKELGIDVKEGSDANH